MKHGITTLFCLLLISLPANAQQRELKAGINYTTLAKPKASPPPAEALPAENAVAGDDAEKKEQDPAALVWNKYKELATGQTLEQIEEQKEVDGAPEKPKTPAKPSIDKPAVVTSEKSKEQAQQSGFAAILNEWKNTKDTQREMRSKSFKTPNSPSKTANDPS